MSYATVGLVHIQHTSSAAAYPVLYQLYRSVYTPDAYSDELSTRCWLWNTSIHTKFVAPEKSY